MESVLKPLKYTLIGTDNVEYWWPRAAPWILQAIGESDSWEGVEQIRRDLLMGTAQLWLVMEPHEKIKLALITETLLFEGQPTCVLRWAGGEGVKELTFDIGFIESWARSRGITSMKIWGRRGWERLFKPLGYTHEYSVLQKTLVERIH